MRGKGIENVKVMPLQHLQEDFYKLTEQSEKWQMLFNVGKWKCLHTGHGNEDIQ